MNDESKIPGRTPRSIQDEIIGRCAGGIAHDLNNFLGGVTSYAELLELEETLSEEGVRRLRELRAAADRHAELLEAVLIAARDDDGKTAPVDVAVIFQQAVALKTFAMRRAGINIKVVCTCVDVPKIELNRGRLLRAFLSMLDAVVLTPNPPNKKVGAACTTSDGKVRIRISPLNNDWANTDSATEDIQRCQLDLEEAGAIISQSDDTLTVEF